jgi:hypothetical protein
VARRYRSSRNTGFERAREHIAEARALTEELGGTDQDVKQWFFNLPDSKLKDILDLYEKSFGQKAADYARETMPIWKNGSRQMSGLVAGRLFTLLPPVMPVEAKFQLVESLWAHVAPSNKRLIEVGPDVPMEEVMSAVEVEVRALSTKWTVPDPMKKRFEWLAHKDAATYEKLLAHLKEQEKQLAERVLKKQIPELKDKFDFDLVDTSSRLSYVIEVGRQSVELRMSHNTEAIRVSDWTPVFLGREAAGTEGNSALPWIGGLLLLLWFLVSSGFI